MKGVLRFSRNKQSSNVKIGVLFKIINLKIVDNKHSMLYNNILYQNGYDCIYIVTL